ncbi:hypothetical protein BU26DRAFT_499391 [Trematosphaeria pertusa]|uniref:Uncharacterized protein n=1 Tax=Trematosphaeria pertusa TaxID=390896 RepID=A0A6A6J3H0_9PLEO|nr:uncharacterized protein BU26DRAFT_499391 [Trematosphaeria pertusa]KAF2256762.1 hypothetical protein BU26DRAFT_499391 [Trematosphaeria pertusa]
MCLERPVLRIARGFCPRPGRRGGWAILLLVPFAFWKYLVDHETGRTTTNILVGWTALAPVPRRQRCRLAQQPWSQGPAMVQLHPSDTKPHGCLRFRTWLHLPASYRCPPQVSIRKVSKGPPRNHPCTVTMLREGSGDLCGDGYYTGANGRAAS